MNCHLLEIIIFVQVLLEYGIISVVISCLLFIFKVIFMCRYQYINKYKCFNCTNLYCVWLPNVVNILLVNNFGYF